MVENSIEVMYIKRMQVYNSSLPRLIRFIYVNVFCQKASTNFGRVAYLQKECMQAKLCELSHTLKYIPWGRLLT